MKILGPVLNATWAVSKLAVKGTWYTAVGVSTAAFWSGHALAKGVGLAADAARASASTHDGQLLCPRGHAVDDLGTFECGACGFVWAGVPWYCPNPECGAETPFLPCPTCGLSVRNPYRLVA